MEKALIDIKTWLAEKNVIVTEIKDSENAFTLEVMPKSSKRALPIEVIGTRQTEEKIIVCWTWVLFEEDTKAISMLDSKVRDSFLLDVQLGFQLMNLPIIFHESIENLQVMYTEKYLNVNKLTKENLMNTFSELIQALEFTSKKFVDHFSMPTEFDPSSHV